MYRQRKQIATRQFKLLPQFEDFSGVDKYFSDRESSEKFKAKLKNLSEQNRHYSYIGGADCDNLFLLEALNISATSREFALVSDFSNCLDLALHSVYGCKVEDIRKCRNYSEISRAITNYDFSTLGDSEFADLLDTSEELRKAFSELSLKSQKEDIYYHDRLKWIVFQFYKTVLCELSLIKYFAMLQVCIQSSGSHRKGVIHSVSYSSIMAASEYSFNEIVTLQMPSGLEYDVAFRTFKPFEYTGEVLRHENVGRRDII